MVPITGPSDVRCTCTCDCGSDSGRDGALWVCASHCGNLVCGACIAIQDPVICHWCVNPLYIDPDRRPGGCIPDRLYSIHGFVAHYNPILERMPSYGWVVPLAAGRYHRNPMYNHNGVRFIDNFTRCFFSPSLVKVPIDAVEFFIRARYVGGPNSCPSTGGTINIFRGNERYGVYFCDVFTHKPPCRCGKCHHSWLRQGWNCNPQNLIRDFHGRTGI